MKGFAWASSVLLICSAASFASASEAAQPADADCAHAPAFATMLRANAHATREALTVRPGYVVEIFHFRPISHNNTSRIAIIIKPKSATDQSPAIATICFDGGKVASPNDTIEFWSDDRHGRVPVDAVLVGFGPPDSLPTSWKQPLTESLWMVEYFDTNSPVYPRHGDWLKCMDKKKDIHVRGDDLNFRMCPHKHQIHNYAYSLHMEQTDTSGTHPKDIDPIIIHHPN